MTESTGEYRYVGKEETDITLSKEQKNERIEKQSIKFSDWLGVNKFRKYKDEKLRELKEERVEIFKSLKSIDSDFKSSYLDIFECKENRLVKVDLSKAIFLEYGDKVLYILSFLLPVSITLFLSLSNKEHRYPILESIGINLVYLIAVIFLSYIISVKIDPFPFLWGKSKYKKIAKAILLPFISTSTICLITFGLIFENYTNNSSSLILLKGVIALGWSLSTMISPLLLYVIPLSSIIFAQQRRGYPESILVHGLLEVLHELENKSHQWGLQDFREQIWIKLKGLATDLQYSSKGSFNSNKPFKGIGSALCNYEPWLREPRASTYEDFKVRMIKNFRYSISGHVGEIEQSETKDIALGKSILNESIPFLVALLYPLWMLLVRQILPIVPGFSIATETTNKIDTVIATLLIFLPLLAKNKELLGKIGEKAIGFFGSK